jgi:hypothetical protein
MATYNKGGAGGALFASDLEGDKVWALYVFWAGTMDTKRGASRAVKAEVYELDLDAGSAVRAGTGVFFQTALVKLPFEQWSAGRMHGPHTTERTWYGLDWPDDVPDAQVDACMDRLPEHPELPEEETEVFPADEQTASSSDDDEPF